MMPDWLAITIAGLGVVLGGGGIWGLLNGRVTGTKIAAEAAQIGSQIWGAMVGDLRQQVDRQQAAMTAMQGQMATMQSDMATMQDVMMQTAHRAQRAETHANSIHDWIDRGMDPPPPQRPPWLPPSASTPSSIIQPPRPKEQ